MINTFKNNILPVGLLLAAFAIGATSLVTLTEQQTHDKIIENERQTLLAAIGALVAEEKYNNDILTDTILLPATTQLGTREPSIVYRARLNDQAVAVVHSAIAPDGYNGKIKLLIGIYHNGQLAGVRVISHKETPGLGDKINEKKSDWILGFADLSLQNPDQSRWKVKKDGGDFDQFTGATITPRAIVSAVEKALQHYKQHGDDLFDTQTMEKEK